MQISRHHPRPTESDSLKMGSRKYVQVVLLHGQEGGPFMCMVCGPWS